MSGSPSIQTPIKGGDRATTQGSETNPVTTPTSDMVPGFQVSMNDLTQMVMQSMSHPEFLDTFAPIVASVLSPLINQSIQKAMQPLEAKVDYQQSQITSQQSQITALQTANKNLACRVDKLQRTVDELTELDLANSVPALEDGLDELEQYGRRNSLRFHNVTIPEGEKDTDKVIVQLCQETLNVTITSDDICRSHPIGRPNRKGKSQVICRFRNWKIKNSIYSVKKELKGNDDNIFITEDLTQYRQSIVGALADAKRAGYIDTYWTTDGRSFCKVRD